MPNADKILYAGWKPERYLIKVDADGGNMELGGTFSTYFKIDYNEMIDEYAGIRRDYVEDREGDYVYLDFSYENLMDAVNNGNTALQDGSGNLDFPGALRKSFYVQYAARDSIRTSTVTVGDKSYSYSKYFTAEQFDAFMKKVPNSNDLQHYKLHADEYSLLAWFRVIDDQGNTEATPYNFMNHVEEDIRLKAKWVQVGKYTIAYNPTMSSTGITGDMARYNDPLESNRYYTDDASAVVLQAPTNLRVDETYLPDDEGDPTQSSHHINPNEYIFRGWRIVDEDGKPKENNVFYNPGDSIRISSTLSVRLGDMNVIHMEAYYEKKESTTRRVDDTSLTLYANLPNQNNGGTVNSEGLDPLKNEHAYIADKKIVLDRQQNNFEVDLKKYINNFSNTYGYKLIGWDKPAGAHDYTPDYCSDAVIGVDNKNLPNELYAIWEPMVYLTLKNDTNASITFNLTFANYTGQINVVDDHLRTPFVIENGEVTLTAGQEVKLAIPDGENFTYTVSGTAPSALYLYNSGGTSGQFNSSASYTTSGSLIKDPQGQLVMFSDSNPTTILHVKAAYYDSGTWKLDEGDQSRPTATPQFANVTGQPSVGDGSTVNLINNNAAVKFDLNVTHTNTSGYKFIGWYSTTSSSVIPAPKPNEPTVDGNPGIGDENITGISVPLTETYYYALYVPYVNGNLTIKHSLKADSAGKCADDGLKLVYDNTTYTSTAQTKYARLTVNVHEQNLTDSDTLNITVGAKPKGAGVYKGTYLGETKDTTATLQQNGYYEFAKEFAIKNLLTASDTVKGLMILNDVYFYSEFSLGYKITYNYTARDGKPKSYVLTGTLNSFNEAEFKEFVINRTPYTRTLTGDTVWDTDKMTVSQTDSDVTAVLNEIPDVRGTCKVTLNMLDGIRYETVPYGETFTKAQATKRLAPAENEVNGQTLYFDHWTIINTHTGDHISDCYDREFHFAVWNDYTITPVYSAAPTGEPTTEGWRFVTIDYIDTSRNQWTTADGVTLTDRVVADMDITFNNGTSLILDTFDNSGNYAYKLGVIFEQVGTTADGTYDKEALSAKEDTTDYQVIVKNRVRSVLDKPNASGTGTDNPYGTTMGYYYSRINISESTVSTYNRSEFARSFTTASVKNKVFRVYAYMVLPGADDDNNITDGEIVLSEPYYMTMFDHASTDLVIDRVG